MKLLLQFVENLDKLMYSAYEGAAVSLPPFPKVQMVLLTLSMSVHLSVQVFTVYPRIFVNLSVSACVYVPPVFLFVSLSARRSLCLSVFNRSICPFLSDEGPVLETLDYTIRIGSTPIFLYFDLYLYSAYAAHCAYFICPNPFADTHFV